MALGMQVGLGPLHIVLDGDTAATPKGAESHPIFGRSLSCPNGCMDQDVTWYGGRPPVGLRDIVFDVDPVTPRKRAHSPHPILAHVYCGQMVGWMKMPHGTEVDLGPGHIILDGVPAPAKGAQQPPLFGPYLLWPRSPISAIAELLYKLSHSGR